MHLLTRADLTGLVTMADAIALMRSLFVEMGRGDVDLPERAVLELDGGRSAALFMPAHVPAMGGLGLKMVGVFPDNPAIHDLPRVLATIVLLDPATGRLVACMDGTWITALRTAAVSAVATDLLARRDARRLVVFGAGVQARSHVEALLEVRGVERVTLVAPRRESRDRVVADLRSAFGDRCHVAGDSSADDALAEADLVVTATTATSPVFDGRRLPPGTHVNAVGSFRPAVRELDEHTILRSRVFVDHRASALAEAGDILMPMAEGRIEATDVLADLGELVCARHPGRTSRDEITVFKSVGLAAEDVVVGRFALERALAAGAGRSVEW